MTASDVAKTLCERKRALERRPDKILPGITDRPRFLCKKCGRVANKKKYVCRPRKLDPAAARDASRRVA